MLRRQRSFRCVLPFIIVAAIQLGLCHAETQPNARSNAEATPVIASAATDSAIAKLKPTLKMEPYRFEPHQGEPVAAELGRFQVPENRHDVNSRTIELAFVRFPATTDRPGPPIVYLAGGPGGSGIETAKGRRFPLFMALRQLGDVIAFDQRGTGMSNGIPFCEAAEPWPPEKPSDRSSMTTWLEGSARHCARFWRQAGIDLDGYTTEQSADDLNALSRELGAEKLRLWSISYGTHLAFSAIRRHGDVIERVVLASAEGPDETIKLPARTEAFLKSILSPADMKAFRRVLDRLETQPVVVDTAHPRSGERGRVGIGKLDLQLLVGFLIKNPESQALLPMAIAAMDQGDFSAVAPYLFMFSDYMGGMRGMPEVMDAVSGISPERAAKVRRQAAGTLLEDTLNYPGPALAKALGVADLGPEFRAPLVSDVPVLFLSGDRDGRTYVESHQELASGFANGIHVIVEGAGHDLFMAAPEVTERIVTFLAGRPTSSAAIKVR